jgi:signal-transduction protein with cAMP-binding, CBS, and nucleotidyltransferase domain
MKTAQDILNDKGGDIISVSHTTSLYDALQTMIAKKVGAVVVTRDDLPVGIWTSRDLMRNTVEDGFDPRNWQVGTYMTSGLISASHTDTAFNLMDKILGRRINHLLIEKDGRLIGLLSSGDVMRAAIQEKTEELARLNKMVSWEYYEQWGWEPKRSPK